MMENNKKFNKKIANRGKIEGNRKTIKMTIAYDGSRYLGWQRLQGKQEGAAIQDIIEKKLSVILKRECKIHGAGRTDAGVHAYGQVAHFSIAEKEYVNISDKSSFYDFLKDFKKQLNIMLPEDIKVLKVEEVQPDFHSRYNARAKTYTYFIENGERPGVFDRKYVLWVPEVLNIEAMRKGAEYLKGTHDFKGFSSKMKDGRETVKTIYDTSIEVKGKRIALSVIADGFLYHMMRIITGTILEIGMGKRQPETIMEIFKNPEKEKAGYTVSGNGLFLKEIFYQEDFRSQVCFIGAKDRCRVKEKII